MSDAINIIVDWRDPQSPLFIEIEDDKGRSVKIGKITKEGEFTKIRITYADILKMPDSETVRIFDKSAEELTSKLTIKP